MNVAVSSVGKELESEVDQRFARARYFLIVDQDSNIVRVIDNIPNVQLPGGAGVQAASLLMKEGIKTVLTAHCGPRAFQVLNAAGIEVYTVAEGKVSEAIQRYRDGELSKADMHDVEGHWF